MSYGATSGPYRFERVSLEQGVSHNLVYAILQDKKGFLWFGTMFGLVRYDGYTYTVFRHDPDDSTSLSNDDITAIFEDHKGFLWVGTYGGGLNKLDRTSGRFVRYLPSVSHLNSLSHGVIWSMSEDSKGLIWIGTGNGLCSLDPSGGTFTRYMNSATDSTSIGANVVLAVHVDRMGTLWVGTQGGGLNRFNASSGRFTRFIRQPSAINSISGNIVRTIYEEKSSAQESPVVLWVGTRGGLTKFIPSERRFENFRADTSNQYSLSANAVGAIAQDGKGDIWVGTERGLNRLDRSTGTFSRFLNDPNNLNTISSDNIVALCCDQGGILWIGSYLGGLDRMVMSPKNFSHLGHNPRDPASLSQAMVRALHEDSSGVLWVGTSAGLGKLDDRTSTFTHFTNNKSDPQSLSGYEATTIHRSRGGALWVGTSRGLNRFDEKRGTFKRYLFDNTNPYSLSNNAVSVVYEDRTGRLWIGTQWGLNRYEVDSDRFTRFVNVPGDSGTITDNYILSIYESSDNALWVGTFGGLHRFDVAQNRFTLFRADPGNPTSISNNYPLSMLEDHAGRMWIGTGGGLNLFNPSDGTFAHFTEKDGLPNSVICGILEDGRGNLWLSTNKGISCFNPQLHTFKNFNLSDGLQSNMFTVGACVKRKDGTLVFGGINGITLFNPESLKTNMHIPAVVVTGFMRFNGRDENFKGDVAYLDQIELPYDENFFAFSFAALDFLQPMKNRYAYKMDGFDPDWVNSGNAHFARYTDLDPGEYVFRVKGSNNDGVWNETGSSIKIRIIPPFWKTTWFYFLSIIILASFVGLIYQQRVRAKVRHSLEVEHIRRAENERVRKKAANDFHDELGHRLTKIGLFSEIVKRKLYGASTEITGYLDKIIDDAQNLTNETRDFLWSLDPAKDSLHDVVVYLKDFGDELFDRTEIAFTIHGLAENLRDVHLSMEARRHLTLIFKEAMHNALKHAGCASVKLAVNATDATFAMSFVDDGHGYNGMSNGNGQGVKNMKLRAEKIAGEILFTSQNGSGVQITVTVPVKSRTNGHAG